MKRGAFNCKLTDVNVRRSKRLMGVPAPEFLLPVYRQPWWRAIPAYEPLEEAVDTQRAPGPPDTMQHSPLPPPVFSVPNRRRWSEKASMDWPTVAPEHLEQDTEEDMKQGDEQHGKQDATTEVKVEQDTTEKFTQDKVQRSGDTVAEDSESSVQGSLMLRTPRTPPVRTPRTPRTPMKPRTASTPPSPAVTEYATTEVKFEQDTFQRSGFTDAEDSECSGQGSPMPRTPNAQVSTPSSTNVQVSTPNSVSTMDSAYQDFCSRRDAFLNECCSRLF